MKRPVGRRHNHFYVALVCRSNKAWMIAKSDSVTQRYFFCRRLFIAPGFISDRSGAKLRPGNVWNCQQGFSFHESGIGGEKYEQRHLNFPFFTDCFLLTSGVKPLVMSTARRAYSWNLIGSKSEIPTSGKYRAKKREFPTFVPNQAPSHLLGGQCTSDVLEEVMHDLLYKNYSNGWINHLFKIVFRNFCGSNEENEIHESTWERQKMVDMAHFPPSCVFASPS